MPDYFTDRWLAIEAKLKENAEPLGVAQGNITRGDWQKDLPIAPPGVVIYMESGDRLFASNPLSTVATVTVFCIVAPESNLPDAVGAATDLAWKVIKVLREMGGYVRWPRNPVEVDTVNTDIAVTMVSFLTAFDMPSLAPITAGISTIPGMQLWLDADAIVGVADSEGLRTWIDRSGLAHDALQLDDAAKPIYQTDRVNGKPALLFTGPHYMLCPKLPLVGLTATVVCRMDYPGFNVGVLWQQNTFAWRLDDGGGQGAYTWATIQPRGFGGSNFQHGNWSILTMTYSPITSRAALRENGHEYGSDLAQTGDLLAGQTDLKVGRGFFADMYGEIAEVAIYDRLLTDSELGQVEAYLAGKYAITLTP